MLAFNRTRSSGSSISARRDRPPRTDSPRRALEPNLEIIGASGGGSDRARRTFGAVAAVHGVAEAHTLEHDGRELLRLRARVECDAAGLLLDEARRGGVVGRRAGD